MPLSRGHHGQILLPGLAIILILMTSFMYFVRWGERTLWQMRMNLAADAAALSAARGEAEMLNNIAAANVMINYYVQKTEIPLRGAAIGIMQASDRANYEDWNHLLHNLIWGFKTLPAGIGETVARLNGAEGHSVYFPFPMDPYLVGKDIYVAMWVRFIPIPQFLSEAYYARAWSPDKLQAQPPHTTTWLVSRKGVRATASARLWLDVSSGGLANNGGFPRVNEGWIRGIGVQGFYPQFNARLLADSRLAPDQLLKLAAGRRG